MQNTQYEIKPIAGYEGKYSVSNTGQVFSHDYKRSGKVKELKPCRHNNDYLFVSLYQDRKRNRHYIHSLVLQTFVPNPDNKPECDHIDGNRTNNHASNLRWVTRTENRNNPITLKRNSEAQKDKSTYKFRNKNTGEVFIGMKYDFYTKYNLNQSNVSSLVNGRLKSVKGWVLFI